MTEEKIDELNSKYEAKLEELVIVKLTTEIDKWSSELDEFVEAYKIWTRTHSNLDKKTKSQKTGAVSKSTISKSAINTVSKAKVTTKPKPNIVAAKPNTAPAKPNTVAAKSTQNIK